MTIDVRASWQKKRPENPTQASVAPVLFRNPKYVLQWVRVPPERTKGRHDLPRGIIEGSASGPRLAVVS